MQSVEPPVQPSLTPTTHEAVLLGIPIPLIPLLLRLYRVRYASSCGSYEYFHNWHWLAASTEEISNPILSSSVVGLASVLPRTLLSSAPFHCYVR